MKCRRGVAVGWSVVPQPVACNAGSIDRVASSFQLPSVAEPSAERCHPPQWCCALWRLCQCGRVWCVRGRVLAPPQPCGRWAATAFGLDRRLGRRTAAWTAVSASCGPQRPPSRKQHGSDLYVPYTSAAARQTIASFDTSALQHTRSIRQSQQRLLCSRRYSAIQSKRRLFYATTCSPAVLVCSATGAIFSLNDFAICLHSVEWPARQCATWQSRLQ